MQFQGHLRLLTSVYTIGGEINANNKMIFRIVGINQYLLYAWAAIIGGTGGRVPQKFCLGDGKASVLPTIATSSKKYTFFHFSCHQTLFSSLQNAYSSEELNGLVYYQNSIFFQLQRVGGLRPLIP